MSPPSRIALVVEDDPLVSKVIERLLTRLGFAVRAVRDGAEAIDLLRADAALDLLVTDYNLGAGPDGAAVAREGRRALPDLAVVLMSGGVTAETALEGRTTFLQKPFTTRSVTDAVERALALSAPPPPAPSERPG